MTTRVWTRQRPGFYTCFLYDLSIERFANPMNGHFGVWRLLEGKKIVTHCDSLRQAKFAAERCHTLRQE